MAYYFSLFSPVCHEYVVLTSFIDATSHCYPPSTPSLDWKDALGTTVQFCRNKDGYVLEPGTHLHLAYPHGDLTIWIEYEMTADYTYWLTYTNCIELFGAIIQDCGQPKTTYGGSLDWKGVHARFAPTWKPAAWEDWDEAEVKVIEPTTDDDATPTPGNDTTSNSNVSSLQTRDTPYDAGVYASCYPSYGRQPATWQQALGAAYALCQANIGFELLKDSPLHWVYGNDSAAQRIELMLFADIDYTLSYMSCISLFGKIVLDCGIKGGSPFGGLLAWKGLYAQYWPTDLPAQEPGPWVGDYGDGNAVNRVVDSDAAAIEARDGAQGCLVAEATPIDKQVASQAIGQFCPKHSDKLLPAGEGVSDVITVGDIKIAMQVVATADAGYMLHIPKCFGWFTSLLTDCSSGYYATTTKGGTVNADGAAWTLSMAYI